MAKVDKKKGLPLWIPLSLACGAIVLVGILVGRFYLYVPYRAPSGSMYPTIAMGTTLWADQSNHEPVRGAVVMFRYPEQREHMFAKRIIGLPGETITVKGREVFVDGKPIPTCPLGKHSYEADGQRVTGELAVEFLPSGAHLVFYDAASLQFEQGGTWPVKSGEFFVLGDNRNNSHDSRLWFGGTGGGVPLGDLVGHVRGLDAPRLPPGADDLRGALDACLAKRPAG